jgi:hypothetical protein
VFWRRVLHTCHHRTQLTVYLRLLNKPVPSVYGRPRTRRGRAPIQQPRLKRRAESKKKFQVSSFEFQVSSQSRAEQESWTPSAR